MKMSVDNPTVFQQAVLEETPYVRNIWFLSPLVPSKQEREQEGTKTKYSAP
jgi:hypothetical protein